MYKKEQVDKIKELIDCYVEIVNSEKNKINLKLWKSLKNWNRDKLRGVPSKEGNINPYTICLDNSLWGKLLNTSLIDYYNDPYTQMEMQLKMKIYHFNNIKDNTAFTDELYIWFGVVTELNLFGCEPVFFNHREPWIKNR